MPYRDLLRFVDASVETIGTGESAVTQQLSTLLISIRRHLHAHPEVGFQEYETYAFLREMLEMHGLEPVGPVAGTGLYVDIHGSRPGRAVGYRADIDALPIQDEKNVSYRSTRPGVAHLCGHDAHTAVAFGTALVLSELRDRFPGMVRVFFQPNEEGTPSGAPRMIEAGVLEGLEAVYALHVDPTLEAGRFGLISGAVSAAADRFRVIVRGSSTGHSARPHQYVDTVWIATQVASSLYQLIGRRTDARNPAVLTICRIHGGEAYNVIPSEVELGGTLRSTDPHQRVEIKSYIRDVASSIGRTYGADVEVELIAGSPAVVNDHRLISLAAHVISDQLGERAVYWVPVPSMGSEDFAHYVQHVPGALIRLGTSSGPATSHTLHNASFDLDESVLAPAATMVASLLRAHLQHSPLAEAAVS